MMIDTFVQLKRLSCCDCATEFAISEQLYNRRINDGQKFFCPNGHSQVFTESENTILKKQLGQALASKKFYEERSERYREAMIKEENRNRGLKSALTLTKRRIAKGKCPCCERIFNDLAAHMSEKHKEYKSRIEKL
jgi:hypothetical protein